MCENKYVYGPEELFNNPGFDSESSQMNAIPTNSISFIFLTNFHYFYSSEDSLVNLVLFPLF